MPNSKAHSEPSADERSTDRRDRAGSVERLVDGATATFAERGYGAASIKEICARANVGIGTFYAHFGNKRELLRAVFGTRGPWTRHVTAEHFLHHDRLVAFLGAILHDPVMVGLLRAWQEAVLEEPEIEQLQGVWREERLRETTAAIAEAQRRSGAKGPLLDATVVAWATSTLAREMMIHQRKGAPDLDTFARLIEELAFGPLIPTKG